jgi:hypothetical protein
MKVCEIMYSETFKAASLCNNRAVQYIESLSQDTKERLLTRIECSPKCSLLVDESTDGAGLDQLLVFVRYCFEKTSKKSSVSVCCFQRNVQGVIHWKH